MSARDQEKAELPEVLRAYGFPVDTAQRIESGLINATYRVSDRGGRPLAALQRLHPIFGPEVNLDIAAVTAHLEAAGLETPRPIETVGGRLWVQAGGGVWRALTWIEGVTKHRLEHPGEAEAAGELVGRFHRALSDLRHEFAFARASVHDTAAHLSRLREAVDASEADHELEREAAGLGRDILEAAAGLPALGELPRRVCHGDLKISNVLFSPGGAAPRSARCLIDLDTLGYQTLAYELGDALRSWCNPAGEDARAAAIDEELFQAATLGYARGAGDLLTEAERASLVPGLETICVELAARFCRDVFDDAYFGWDPARFSSRREHNLVRAGGQLALARSIRSRREALAKLAS